MARITGEACSSHRLGRLRIASVCKSRYRTNASQVWISLSVSSFVSLIPTNSNRGPRGATSSLTAPHMIAQSCEILLVVVWLRAGSECADKAVSLTSCQIVVRLVSGCFHLRVKEVWYSEKREGKQRSGENINSWKPIDFCGSCSCATS